MSVITAQWSRRPTTACLAIVALMCTAAVCVLQLADEGGHSVVLKNVEIGSESSTVQDKLQSMDAQLFSDADMEPAEDLVQVEAVGDAERKLGDAPMVRSIEEDALGKAGFVALPITGAADKKGHKQNKDAALFTKTQQAAAPKKQQKQQKQKKQQKQQKQQKQKKQKQQKQQKKQNKSHQKSHHHHHHHHHHDVEEHDEDAKAQAAKEGLEMKLAKAEKKIRGMKRVAAATKVKRTKEREVKRALQRTGGSQQRESQRFFSYMSRWWHLHRHWMKRHNIRLYQKLREHRALSLSHLWKPFLLRWHYVQPRLLQGYRYDWNDDGTYTTKRFLMKSMQKTRNGVVSARIRSVNNICFPGFLPPKKKLKWCTHTRSVSARAVQFSMEHKPFRVPSLTTMRAYTSFVPKKALSAPKNHGAASPLVRFVSLQGLHWEIHEMVEYCDRPSSSIGVAVPVAYSPKTSSPIRKYSLKFMEWSPIKMDRELLDNGATVESMVLMTKDRKFKIACVIPVNHPQSIDGEEVSLTQQKCSFYVRQWDFTLKCPEGKAGSLAISTKVIARDDRGTGHGKPTLTPRFKGQLAFNKNKVSMQFEQQAVMHVHKSQANNKAVDHRSSVPVIMTQASKLDWTADPRFKTSRRVYFSFIVSNVKKFKESILNWDPELSASFRSVPQVMTGIAQPTTPQTQGAPQVANKQDENTITGAEFMQLSSPTSGASSKFTMSCATMFAMLLSLVIALN